MKKIFAPIIGFAALLGIASCSTDFEVAAPYKNITVGYGLINMNDTAHYIRIEKAFLDESKSAIDMAKVDDSSYFKDLEVTMKEINAGTTVSKTILDRVDLRTEGYVKDSGTFFVDKNYAYKYKHTLNPGYRYRLVINNKTTGEVDSAETNVLNSDTLKFGVQEFKDLGFHMAFYSNVINDNFYLRLRAPTDFVVVQGIVRIKWADKDANGAQTDHYGDITFYSGGPTGNDPNYPNRIKTDYSDLQSQLYNIMGPAPAGVQRYMDSVDFFIWAGTDVFSTYMQYTASQGGLTGDQIKPVYTNFSGANVRGLFTSRTMTKELNVAINDLSIDSLMVSAAMQKLNIRGRSDH